MDTYWRIYGNTYDLEPFLKTHPGGPVILENARGEKDLTSLFEVFHQFSDMNKIKQSLQKYMVAENTYQPINTFDETGFYKVLKERVKTHFINKHMLPMDTKSIMPYIKAPHQLWLDLALAGSAYLFIYYSIIASNYAWWVKTMLSALLGYVQINIGFIAMHDASHYSVSQSSTTNNYLSKGLNTFVLWNFKLWEKHHTIRHHSYTGILALDPDTINFSPYFNKRPSSYKAWLNNVEFPGIEYLYLFILTILPGMYVGQIFCYLAFYFRSKLWGMPCPANCYSPLDLLFALPTFYFIYHSSWTSLFAYMIGLNINYANCIIGDHDTLETVMNEKQDVKDWGEMQVRNSGNFKNGAPLEWFSRLHGGINYQIEHHLFPNISHSFYPELAPIVRETCKQFNIPYIHHPTLMEVYTSYCKLIRMSNINEVKQE